MSKFYVDYNTGAGNFEYEGTLDGAINEAEKGIAFTQQSVKITENDEEVAILYWRGVKAQEDDTVTADYGDFGFYGEWVVL